MAQIAHPLRAGPTTDAQIAAFETYIGHKLPTDYRQFLLQHNGGHPEPDAFLLNAGYGEEENTVLCFFPMRDLKLGNVSVGDLEEQRTLLTTGLVAAGMESLAAGQKRLETPHLAIRYRARRESEFWQS